MENKHLFPAIYPNVVSASSNNPEKTAIPFAHKELKKSLEMILSNSKSEKKLSLLEDMLSDKASSEISSTIKRNSINYT